MSEGEKDKHRREKKKKEKKKYSRYSGPSKFSGDELASVHSSRIGPGVSTTDLIAWAEKKCSFFVKELINEEKQVIMTLRKDLEKVRDAVIKFGDISSDRIAYIENKLYKLTKLMDKKLNSFDVRDAKRRVLPKAKLMVWSGDVMLYQTLSYKSRVLWRERH